MIPEHSDDGFLPEGIHAATWAEVVARFGFSARRQRLLAGLHAALAHLAEAGCPRVLLGGSFVTTKPNPKDVDVVWHTGGVDPELVHPMFLQFPEGRVVTLATFGAEFFPHFLVEHESNLPFPAFFQFSREGQRVGVVDVDLHTLE